jgi:hypothetical protein
MKKFLLCSVAIAAMVILGCDRGSQSAPPPGSATAPADSRTEQQKLAEATPPGCKRECLLNGPECLIVRVLGDVSETSDFRNLHPFAESLKINAEGSLTFGLKGKMEFQVSIFEIGDSIFPVVSKIIQTEAVKFRRVDAENLKLQPVDPIAAPVFTFEDEHLASDWNGSIKSIEFIEEQPIINTGEREKRCVLFR